MKNFEREIQSLCNEKIDFNNSDYRKIESIDETLFFAMDAINNCDCATVDIHDFTFSHNNFKDPQKAFILLINNIIKENSSINNFELSDSERNGIIYPYIDELANHGWKVFEYKTTDKKSIIKRAIYTR